jgi:hypothetical protein
VEGSRVQSKRRMDERDVERLRGAAANRRERVAAASRFF